MGREIHEERDYSDKIAEAIDQEVQAFIQRAYRRAQDILTTHKDKLVEVATYLVQHETVEGEALKRLFEGLPPQEAMLPEHPPSPVVPPMARPVPQPSPSLSIITRTPGI